MPFKPQETPHSSYRRLALTISTSILLSSFLATILSIVYARQLYNAPLNTYLEEEYSYANRHKNYRWSKAWYFFYAPFLPLVTLCHSAIETALLRTRRLNVWWSASTGYVMFVSWVAVVGKSCLSSLTPTFRQQKRKMEMMRKEGENLRLVFVLTLLGLS